MKKSFKATFIDPYSLILASISSPDKYQGPPCSPCLLSGRSWLGKGWCDLYDHPGGAHGKEPACQSRRYKGCKFYLWVRKISWRRTWQPTPVFLLENPMARVAWWATTGSQTVGHKWIDWVCTQACIPGLVWLDLGKPCVWTGWIAQVT